MPSTIQCHTPSYVPNGREVAVFSTERGLVRVLLAGRVAPVNVGNFVELARAGFYDGLKFHGGSTGERIDGGDPMTRTLTGREVLKVAKNRWGAMGMGGPGYFVRGEFANNPSNRHNDGALVMARLGGPDTAGSQFYFCQAPLHERDRLFTVIGQTVEGLDVVHALRPGDAVLSVHIEEIAR